MKTMILVTTLLMGTLAQAGHISKMKAHLPDGTWVGTDGYGDGSATKCKITTKWLSDAELKVTTTTQYENNQPRTSEIIFSESKKAEVTKDELNETDDELTLSQATVLLEEEDYSVDLYENVVLELVDGYKLESIGINIYEVDHESDPHEDVLDCRNLTKLDNI